MQPKGRSDSCLPGFLIILWLSILPEHGMACPKPCACYVQTEVHCTFRYLNVIPKQIQADVERINLGYNSLSKLTESDLSSLRKLELLMLHSNEIQTIHENAFQDLLSLQVLKMSYNKVKTLHKNTFRGLKSMVRLHMDHNKLEFLAPESFYGLTSLKLVHLEGNELRQLHPDTFVTLRYIQIFKTSSIKQIYLSDNQLSSLPKEMFLYLNELEGLYLHGNHWSCDCNLQWLTEWGQQSRDLVKCKRDRSGEQCPLCSSPKKNKGKSLDEISSHDLDCVKPTIENIFKLKNMTTPEEGSFTAISAKDFVAPVGSLILNMTDQSGNEANVACSVQRPTKMSQIMLDRKEQHTIMRTTFSSFLVCNIDYDYIQKLWGILAMYSDSPMKLKRHLLLTKTPFISYKYKQMGSGDDVFTDIEAELRAEPNWLMQDLVTLQLDRTATTLSTLHIRYSTDIYVTIPNSVENPTKNSWVMILKSNQTQTEYAAIIGGTVEMECQVVGEPVPNIEWVLPDGSKIRAPYMSEEGRITITKNGKFILRAADSFDTGVYHCIATNYVDADVLTYRITVVGPDVEEEAVNGVELSVSNGDVLYLPCGSNGVPDASVSWILPDQSVLHQTSSNKRIFSNGTLQIQDITQRERGHFRCLAANQYGLDTLTHKVLVKDRKINMLNNKIQLDQTEEEGSGKEDIKEPNHFVTGKAIGHKRFPSRRIPTKSNGQGNVNIAVQRRNRINQRLRGLRRQFTQNTRKIDPQRWTEILQKTKQNSINSKITTQVMESSAKEESDLERVSGEVEEPSGEELLPVDETFLKVSEKYSSVTMLSAIPTVPAFTDSNIHLWTKKATSVIPTKNNIDKDNLEMPKIDTEITVNNPEPTISEYLTTGTSPHYFDTFPDTTINYNSEQPTTLSILDTSIIAIPDTPPPTGVQYLSSRDVTTNSMLKSPFTISGRLKSDSNDFTTAFKSLTATPQTIIISPTATSSPLYTAPLDTITTSTTSPNDFHYITHNDITDPAITENELQVTTQYYINNLITTSGYLDRLSEDVISNPQSEVSFTSSSPSNVITNPTTTAYDFSATPQNVFSDQPTSSYLHVTSQSILSKPQPHEKLSHPSTSSTTEHPLISAVMEVVTEPPVTHKEITNTVTYPKQILITAISNSEILAATPNTKIIITQPNIASTPQNITGIYVLSSQPTISGKYNLPTSTSEYRSENLLDSQDKLSTQPKFQSTMIPHYSEAKDEVEDVVSIDSSMKSSTKLYLSQTDIGPIYIHSTQKIISPGLPAGSTIITHQQIQIVKDVTPLVPTLRRYGRRRIPGRRRIVRPDRIPNIRAHQFKFGRLDNTEATTAQSTDSGISKQKQFSYSTIPLSTYVPLTPEHSPITAPETVHGKETTAQEATRSTDNTEISTNTYSTSSQSVIQTIPQISTVGMSDKFHVGVRQSQDLTTQIPTTIYTTGKEVPLRSTSAQSTTKPRVASKIIRRKIPWHRLFANNQIVQREILKKLRKNTQLTSAITTLLPKSESALTKSSILSTQSTISNSKAETNTPLMDVQSRIVGNPASAKATTVIHPTSAIATSTTVYPTTSKAATTVIHPTSAIATSTTAYPTIAKAATTVMHPTTTKVTSTTAYPTIAKAATTVIHPTSAIATSTTAYPTIAKAATTVMHPTTTKVTSTTAYPTIAKAATTVIHPTSAKVTSTTVYPTTAKAATTVIHPTSAKVTSTTVYPTTAKAATTVIHPTSAKVTSTTVYPTTAKAATTVIHPTSSKVTSTTVYPTTAKAATTVMHPTTTKVTSTTVYPTIAKAATTVMHPNTTKVTSTTVYPTTAKAATTVIHPTAAKTARTVVYPTRAKATATVVYPTSPSVTITVIPPTSASAQTAAHSASTIVETTFEDLNLIPTKSTMSTTATTVASVTADSLARQRFLKRKRPRKKNPFSNSVLHNSLKSSTNASMLATSPEERTKARTITPTPKSSGNTVTGAQTTRLLSSENDILLTTGKKSFWSNTSKAPRLSLQPSPIMNGIDTLTTPYLEPSDNNYIATSDQAVNRNTHFKHTFVTTHKTKTSSTYKTEPITSTPSPLSVKAKIISSVTDPSPIMRTNTVQPPVVSGKKTVPASVEIRPDPKISQRNVHIIAHVPNVLKKPVQFNPSSTTAQQTDKKTTSDRTEEIPSNNSRSKPRIVGGRAASFMVLANSDAFIPCDATGNPTPTILWTKVSSGTFVSKARRGNKMEVFTNGTLSISSVSVQDRGQYLCVANNQYGSDRLLVTLSVITYPPRIIQGRSREITVHSGSAVNVKCQTEGRPFPTITWILANETIASEKSANNHKVFVQSDGTLSIKEVTIYDRGIYKCLATNIAGADTFTVKIQVIAAPPVILEEKRQTVLVLPGENVKLHCTAKGNPHPSVYWVAFDGTKVKPLHYVNAKLFLFSNGSLYIRNAASSDNGNYECIATSSTGSERRVVNLRVEQSDTIPKIVHASPKSTEMNFGDKLMLNCTATGEPEPRIIWRLPSKAVVDQWHRMGSRIQVYPNGSLIVQSVSEKDAGDYLCVARNKMGDDIILMKVSITMKPAKIVQKQHITKQVPYGKDFKVDCKASGSPLPEISWSLPDGTMINNVLQADDSGRRTRRYVLFDNGTLYLNKVGMAEEGDYTCYAENTLGRDEMKVHISVVTAAPRIKLHPKTKFEARAGASTVLDCEAIGEPKPKVFWLLPSSDMIAVSHDRYILHENGSLSITQVKLLDAGEYMCVARNPAGDDTKLLKLEVQSTPPIINGLYTNKTIIKDSALKHSRKLIHCSAEGTHPLQIMWIMPDNIYLTAPYHGSRIIVHKNGTLEIRNVRPSDIAEFTCVARNDGGESMLVVQLEVLEVLRRPVFKNPFNEKLIAKPGKMAILNCFADGNPTPEIIWLLPNGTRFLNGQRFSKYHAGTNGTFIIYSPSKDDAGKYRCAARNKVGYIEKLMILEVGQKPNILTHPRGPIKNVIGETLSLHCLSDGVPRPIVIWTLPSGFVIDRPQVNGKYMLLDNGTLVIQETTIHDRGNYLCKAKNNAGEASISIPVMIVAYPPRITNKPPQNIHTRAGSPVHLNCMAIGIPKPEITWELPDLSVLTTASKGRPTGTELLHPQGTLVVQKPKSSDSGMYRCIAKNPLGTDSSSTYLKII